MDNKNLFLLFNFWVQISKEFSPSLRFRRASNPKKRALRAVFYFRYAFLSKINTFTDFCSSKSYFTFQCFLFLISKDSLRASVFNKWCFNTFETALCASFCFQKFHFKASFAFILKTKNPSCWMGFKSIEVSSGFEPL